MVLLRVCVCCTVVEEGAMVVASKVPESRYLRLALPYIEPFNNYSMIVSGYGCIVTRVTKAIYERKRKEKNY